MVTSAPDAEPPVGSERNAGISGTRHTVAQDTGTVGAQDNADGKRRFGRIRYAHSGGAGVPPPLGAVPDETAADYDETAGLVYEAPQVRPAGGANPPDRQAADGPAEYNTEYYTPGEEDENPDHGLAIFGGLRGGADDDRDTAGDGEAPGMGLPPAEYAGQASPGRYPGPATYGGQQETPTAGLDRVSATGTGATWNEQIASAPQAVGAAEDSKPGAFRIRLPRLGGSGAAADDGQPRTTVRDLPPDVQLRFWRLRAAIMIGVGLVLIILTRNWAVALTLAILAGIADTIYRARTAANYVNGASRPGAQRRTRRQLARMRRAGYLALDARPIPNSREFIDHLVIGPTGVYAIDSEKWDPKLPIRTWNGKKLYHGPQSQKPRLEHAVWEAGQASEILSTALGAKISVRPALAIYGPKIPWDIATIRDVDVFTGTALRKYLKRRSRMKGEVPRLTGEQVRTIYDAATKTLPDVVPSRTATPVG